METAKAILRKLPWLHSLLVNILENIHFLLKTSYLKDLMLYNRRLRKPDVNGLVDLGMRKIKSFNTKTWRYGHGLDHAFRRYFTAEYENSEVFVKIAQNDETTKNEIKVGKSISYMNFPFIPVMRCYSENFNDNTVMIAFENIKGLHSFSIANDIGKFKEHCKEFCHILDCFATYGIVHADIHKNNLMIDLDNHLVVLDFGISTVHGVNNSVNYVARPGTYFKINQENGRETRCYDDAYSFIEMLKDLHIERTWLELDEVKSIEERIGRNVLTVPIS